MKKFALAVMITAAAAFGFGMEVGAYPPGAGSVTATPASGAPGYTVTVKATCLPGETVTATITGGNSGMATCGAAGTAALVRDLTSAGSATISLVTPTAPGTYLGTITGSVTGSLGNFTITVAGAVTPATPGGGLPATGSGSASTLALVAIGLLGTGVGLFGVAGFRRRHATV